MKVTLSKENEIILEKVYSGVTLKTSDGETLRICMRDTGFEFSYNGVWYSAQKGVLKKIETVKTDNQNNASGHVCKQ